MDVTLKASGLSLSSLTLNGTSVTLKSGGKSATLKGIAANTRYLLYWVFEGGPGASTTVKLTASTGKVDGRFPAKKTIPQGEDKNHDSRNFEVKV